MAICFSIVHVLFYLTCQTNKMILFCSQRKCLNKLLEHECDINIRNNEGLTAVSVVTSFQILLMDYVFITVCVCVSVCLSVSKTLN